MILLSRDASLDLLTRNLANRLRLKRLISSGVSRIRLLAALILRLLEVIPLVLLLVEVLEAQPEADSAGGGDDGHGAIVPDPVGVAGERGPRLAEGRGDGGHEEVDAHDDGLHVVGSLGEGVLVRGGVGEDLGQADEDVGQALCPDVDGRGAFLVSGVIAAGGHLVDVVLHHGGGNHGHGGETETEGHTLQRGEVDADPSKARVDESVQDRDHDDDGDRVEVLNQIVGRAVQLHGRGLSVLMLVRSYNAWSRFRGTYVVRLLVIWL